MALTPNHFRRAYQSVIDSITHRQVESITGNTFDKVLTMAMNGEKQQDIADELNIHKSNVSQHVQRARAERKLRSCVA